MKLRIKGNTLRFRLTQSEALSLHRNGRVQESVRFSPAVDDELVYALEQSNVSAQTTVRHRHCPNEIVITVPQNEVRDWATGDAVGIYGESSVGRGDRLLVSIEKDFACLDGSDEDNADTFPNPIVKTVGASE